MKEVIVHPLPTLTTEIHDVPIPVPEPDQVVIKVAVAGSNVKDWDHITSRKISANSGDDIAGMVHALGKDVEATGEFHIGDHVAAFHRMLSPGGAYAEYAAAPAHTVFHVPSNISFEGKEPEMASSLPPPLPKSHPPICANIRPIEAATMPLIIMTAATALYRCQSLPPPWSPRTSSAPPQPLLIYGASSALGCFAIKLARASNIHPLIAICGASSQYVATLLDASKGDTVIDYRPGVEAMKGAVRQALGPLRAFHALDAISAHGSWVPLAQMLGGPGPEGEGKGGQVSVVSGANAYDEALIPAGVTIKYVYVGTAHDGAYVPTMPKQPADKEAVESAVEFAYVFFRYVARLLARGLLEGHPYTVVPGGLGGVGEGLRMLKAGEARGRKFVYRIGETEGLGEGEECGDDE